MNAYNPADFLDQVGYDDELKDLQKDYDKKMQQNKKISSKFYEKNNFLTHSCFC